MIDEYEDKNYKCERYGKSFLKRFVSVTNNLIVSKITRNVDILIILEKEFTSSFHSELFRVDRHC